MADPDQIKASSKLMLAIGVGLMGLGAAIGVPVTIGNHVAAQQTTARIEACTRIPSTSAAIMCIESITGQIPYGVGSGSGN